MFGRRARKPPAPNRWSQAARTGHGHDGEPEWVQEGAPERLGQRPERDFPPEVEYGEQVISYDNHPPGRGHGDGGYGYGGTAGFGPSGGSAVGPGDTAELEPQTAEDVLSPRALARAHETKDQCQRGG